jgi:bla regulator protein BlaR1
MITTESQLLQSVGWTLVHSLWQAAILYVMYSLASRAFASNATKRYALATATLAIMLVSFVVTFAVIHQTPATGNETPITIRISPAIFGDAANRIVDSSQLASSWIDQNLLWVIRIWLIGSMIGLLRIVSGMSYLYFLRRSAQLVAGNWEEKVNELANGLKIRRRVLIAEARVASPMVIGYLKPMVLFPVGLIAGLSSAQVEAILLHELAHIRRHDFVVNLFQCVMESLFFFNPIVWLLSAHIRVLREHCCDDVVIRLGVEPLAYVKTLAVVEEVGAGRTLAMAFAGERNQLLNRMKRIMERSVVRKEWGRMRLLPIWFALLGLACASWLSIHTETGDQAAEASLEKQSNRVAADTTVEEESSSGYFYRFDAGHEDDVAADPPHPFALPPMPPGHEAFELWEGDSIPGFMYLPGGEWETFEREFTEKFREEFQEFFSKNEDQFEKMMEELRRQHKDYDMMQAFQFDKLSEEQQKAMEQQFQHMPNFDSFPHMPEIPEQLWHEQEMMMADAERMMSKIMSEHSDILHSQEELLRTDELLLLPNEDALHNYEKAMVEQLIADGYLEKGEKLGDLRIHNDDITVNGKKVKKQDVKKYKEIREKYEPKWTRPRRPE